MLGGTHVVQADIGAGIGADPIMLPQPVLAGHSYTMPPVLVVNTGTEPARYAVTVQRRRTSDDTVVPPEWVQFEKNSFTLRPKETATVPVTLNIPADAKPGKYSSTVLAGTVADSPGATALGAQAGTDIKFQVAERPPLIPWPWPWWSYATLSVAATLATGSILVRRLGFSLRLERRV
jgi:hypothetical protein